MSIFLNPCLTFIAFGDWGYKTKSLWHLMETIKGLQYEIDFCILLGDNFYPDGISGVDDPRWTEEVIEMFPSHLRLYSILGNHDYHTNPVAQVQFTTETNNKIWRMPFLFYEEIFDVEDTTVQFLFLDTQILIPTYTLQLLYACQVPKDQIDRFLNLVNGFRSQQLQWLEQQLAQSTSRFKIVCGHYPVLSNGPHEVDPELYRLLMPLFERYGVNLYLSGHDHNAQVIQRNNVHFIVSGCTSTSTRPIQSMDGTLFMSRNTGVFAFEIKKSHLSVRFLNQDQQTEYALTLVDQ